MRNPKGYAIPKALKDMGFKNTCIDQTIPSMEFQMSQGKSLCIWIEHEDPSKHQEGYKRFTLEWLLGDGRTMEREPIGECESEQELIAMLKDDPNLQGDCMSA